MMEKKTDAPVPAVHAVEGFDPASLCRQRRQADGAPVQEMTVEDRLRWFRLCFPAGKLSAEIRQVSETEAVVTCCVYGDIHDAPDQFLARASARQTAERAAPGEDVLALAETAALRRALEAAGFGPAFCPVRETAEEALPSAPVSTERPEAPAEAIPAAPGEQPEAPRDGMSPAEAERILVDFGSNKGLTLGEIARCRSGDLEWYRAHYTGPNQAVRDGAAVLLRALGR